MAGYSTKDTFEQSAGAGPATTMAVFLKHVSNAGATDTYRQLVGAGCAFQAQGQTIRFTYRKGGPQAHLELPITQKTEAATVKQFLANCLKLFLGEGTPAPAAKVPTLEEQKQQLRNGGAPIQRTSLWRR